MNREELARKLESMKGLSGSGTVLSNAVRKLADFVGTMEPGDIVAGDNISAAPIATDLWYLSYHQNFLKVYYEDTRADFNHLDYSTYLAGKMSFLDYLTGLKPLKVLCDLEDQFEIEEGFGEIIPTQYTNNGIYWVNKAFFELRATGTELAYPSDGSAGFQMAPNDYAGYLAIPIGQLGVMEVISLIQETELSGYAFAAYDGDADYAELLPLTDPEDQYIPSVQSPPEMFPEMKDAGQAYCYGRHLIDGYGYCKPETPVANRNGNNSSGTTAYAPTASLDVELWAENIKDYEEAIEPKKWMRYWIHKDSTLPVPGEFIGVLCRPLASPPHVWWFQESAPFLYAGNWMETQYLTSGLVLSVTVEGDRTDGGTGNAYTVAIQGVHVVINASDFFSYSAGDRVAVLKTAAIGTAMAFSSFQQTAFKQADENTAKSTYVIIPATFYKKRS